MSSVADSSVHSWSLRADQLHFSNNFYFQQAPEPLYESPLSFSYAPKQANRQIASS